ncbi:DUF2085 domain-containing protein [Polyangium fumosum]|uniref:DUF2085 domain-containing protein n=1 Tax=Polyangium fumosum TaxID=889272 RepID=A0A4U1IYV8_9BACT|nr:DUF2085 domain-containing protein [Polyangium fumosum]TKC99272.1 DUF2085 domain-containing protein [Polyangium fumosum]
MDRPAGSDGAPRQEAARAGLTLERVLRGLLCFVGVAPFLAPFARRVTSPETGELLYLLFAPVCHLKPERTLALAGVLMPLCSRCAGIFAGFVTAGLFPRPRWSVRACLGYGFIASVIMLADVITQDLRLRPLFHPARLATGVLWGHVFALGILALAREHLARPARVTSSA